MESAAPGSSTNILPTAAHLNQNARPRPNKPKWRRKPPKRETDIVISNPVTSHSQNGHSSPLAVEDMDSQIAASVTSRQSHHRPSQARRSVPVGQSSIQGSLADHPLHVGPSSSSHGQHQRHRPQKPCNIISPGTNNPQQPAVSKQSTGPHGGSKRRAKFHGKLTDKDGPSNTASPSKPADKYHVKMEKPAVDDLTSRLIQELSSPPYPDCPICFSSVYREQPIWSCSPIIPTILPHDAEGPPQYCWTTFHLKCIRSWASKSVQDIEDAWRARGEEGRTGDWRCPGCQGKREDIPKIYR